MTASCAITLSDSLAPLLAVGDHLIDWPSGEELVRVLSLRDYNTRVVVLGVTLLGLAAGTVGTFLLLRKRALLSDAVSHATLPGIVLAFMAMVLWGQTGKSLPGLLVGAAVFGVIGMLAMLAIRQWTRLKDDVALGIVLSVFFGLGTAMIKLAENLPGGSAAGLDRFIYGSAASMLASDAMTMLVAAAVVAGACALLFKEFALVCFDVEYAAAQGWPVRRVDLAMMALAVAVTVIGLQAVGLVLVVAMLIIPPAAARFWTDRLLWMTLASALIGMVSGYIGATLSGVLPRLPTGPIIVVVAAAVFLVSLVAGTRRGVVVRLASHLRLTRRVAMQHLLRAAYEQREAHADGEPVITEAGLLHQRSWSHHHLRRLLGRAQRRGWVEPADGQGWRLTEAGVREAAQVVRNHRLWELYLITHADIAPSHVDRDADAIEHVLGSDMVAKLDRLLAERGAMPASPHPVE